MQVSAGPQTAVDCDNVRRLEQAVRGRKQPPRTAMNALEDSYLGAAIAIGLDHVFCPLFDLELNGQLLLQAGHSTQVGGRAERAALSKGLGGI